MHIATWINIKTLFSEKKSIWKRPPRSPIHRVCFKSIKLVQITENLSNTLKPFPLEVGPRSPWGGAWALFPPHCQRVEQSSLYQRYKKSNWVDFQALAGLQQFRAHSRETGALWRPGRACRFTHRVCSRQSQEFSDRPRLTRVVLQSKGEGRDVWSWVCLSLSVGLLPMAPSSGITAPKKGTPRSALPGGWH